MGKEPLSDEERMVRARRRFRESIVLGLIFGLVLAGFGTFYVIADARGVFQRLGFSHAQAAEFFGWACGVVMVAFFIGALLRYWPAKADRAPSFLRKDMDNIHRRWRWITVIMSFFASEQTLSLLRTTQSLNASIVAPLAFVLFSLAIMVCFGPGWISRTYRETLNDELMRTHRARAARIGYLLLMSALTGLTFVLLYRPQNAIQAALIILCAGSVIPSLYFVILDWRAEGHDG